jgi:hypothetical protein
VAYRSFLNRWSALAATDTPPSFHDTVTNLAA